MATHASMSSSTTTRKKIITPEDSSEIADDLYPFLRRYKDGRVERLVGNTLVPASEAPGAKNGGVATRDVVIDHSTGVSARLFLNVVGAVSSSRKTMMRLPIIVYFHGGGFCTGSAFSKVYHRYAASLSARAAALVVSVDYRLAPEHPIPAAFDDAWTALQWVTCSDDPWLAYYADHTRIFLAGESAGANIAHNVAARVGSPEGVDIDIEGMILVQPFFWGPDRLPQEIHDHDRKQKMLFVPDKVDMFWPFLTAGTAGNDDPRLNPTAEVVASVACRRALVAVASKDLARHRGRRYAEWLRNNGGECCREVRLVESEGEDHAFHLYRPARTTAVELMDLVAEFINGRTTPAPPPTTTVLKNPAVLNLRASHKAVCCRATLANSTSINKIVRVTPRSIVVVGPGKAASVVLPRFGGLLMGPMKILM